MLATATLALYGDKSALAQIKTNLKSPDTKIRARAIVERAAVNWWQGTADPIRQYAVVDGVGRMTPPLLTYKPMLMLYPSARRGAATPELCRDLSGMAGWASEPPATAWRASTLKEYKITDREAGRPFHLYGATIRGGMFSTFANKGKPCVIDIWATWCPWCIKGLPDITAIYNKYHSKGLQVVSVSEDSNFLTLRRFLAQHPEMKWPQLYRKTAFYVTHGQSKPISMDGYPTTVVVNSKGIIVDIICGYAKGVIEADVKSLFQKK